MAIACGLKKVADDREFRRLVVSRPIFPLGRDMGFLPGDVSEKLNPWMKPIFDNLDLLLGEHDRDDRRGGGQPSYQALLDQGILEVEPLTYIRGRSMPRQYLVVDEAQNLTPHEVKTVLTRARGDEDHPHGGSVPDRQPVRGLHIQRSHLRGRAVQGEPGSWAHHAPQG